MPSLQCMRTAVLYWILGDRFGGLQCKGSATFETMEPRALGLEDFAGVFVLLAVGGAVGLVILGLEHCVYRLLPRLRRSPKNSIWRSRHVMFFSQKLYRFINCVDLVSPNSSAKEFASSLKQGQVRSEVSALTFLNRRDSLITIFDWPEIFSVYTTLETVIVKTGIPTNLFIENHSQFFRGQKPRTIAMRWLLSGRKSRKPKKDS